MTDPTPDPAGAISPPDRRPLRPHPRRRRATARSGSCPTTSCVERIDSTDQWIRERSGIVEPPLGRARRDPSSDMAESGRPGGARARPASTPRRSTPSSSPPSPTRTRPRPPPRSSPTGWAPPRPRRWTSRPPARASATASRLADDMVRGGSAEYVLVVGVEKLSDFTDLTRPLDRVPLRRRRRRRRDRPVRHPGHRPHGLGLGRRRSGRPSSAASTLDRVPRRRGRRRVAGA